MKFIYNFFHILPIALIIFSQCGCVTDREFRQHERQLDFELECYKQLEPFYRNNDWTADEIIGYANKLNNNGFSNTKEIFHALAYGYYLKSEYKKSAEMMHAYFNADFACNFEIEDSGDQRLAAIDDSIAHLHLSQIYKNFGEEDKFKKEFDSFLNLWAMACSREEDCAKESIDSVINTYSW